MQVLYPPRGSTRSTVKIRGMSSLKYVDHYVGMNDLSEAWNLSLGICTEHKEITSITTSYRGVSLRRTPTPTKAFQYQGDPRHKGSPTPPTKATDRLRRVRLYTVGSEVLLHSISR